MATVSVGTPGQQQTLAIDTGSSDVWVLAVSADACTDPSIQEQAMDGCDSTCKSRFPSVRLDFLTLLCR